MPTSRERFEKEAMPYLQEIYASAMRLTRQREAAEDLASEVYTRAWKSFDQFEPGTNLRAWLYKILTNTFINHYRHKQREPVMVELDRSEETRESTGSGGMLFDRLATLRARASENPDQVLANHILDENL